MERIVSGIALIAGFLAVQGCSREPPDPSRQPFLVSLTYVFEDGGETLEAPRLARNSRGATVELGVPTPDNGQQGRIILETDPPRRRAIDPVTESTVTYVRWNGRRPLEDERCQYAGRHDGLAGIEAFESARWADARLACLVKEVALREAAHLARLVGASVHAVSVSFGEPPEELFETPVSYIERSPSQVVQELARRRPELCGDACLPNAESMGRLDAAYLLSRSQP